MRNRLISRWLVSTSASCFVSLMLRIGAPNGRLKVLQFDLFAFIDSLYEYNGMSSSLRNAQSCAATCRFYAGGATRSAAMLLEWEAGGNPCSKTIAMPMSCDDSGSGPRTSGVVKRTQQQLLIGSQLGCFRVLRATTSGRFVTTRRRRRAIRRRGPSRILQHSGVLISFIAL